MSPEINALSTLMFVAVLVLLVVINLRQARQNARDSGRRKARAGRPLPRAHHGHYNGKRGPRAR